MSHPLASGFPATPPIQARLTLNAIPGGGCIDSLEELQRWLETSVIEFVVKSNSVVFGSSGTIDAATVADRDKPRLVFDDEGRCYGFALYSPEAKAWVRTGVPGELLTIFRTEDTVARDMEVKLLKNGWLICDGETPGAPDLVGTDPDNPNTYADNDFFRKTETEWDIYTVIKVA